MNITDELVGSSRIKIFVGEFGSGKTELAVNYALALRRCGFPTAIVDLDLVKPYFRTRENRDVLEAQGVLVVAPEKRLSHADLPVLPHELARVLATDDYQVIIDVGGGDAAIVLGQVYRQLANGNYQAMMVVNTCRPFTSNPEGIISTLRRLEQVARLKISGLVSNTNLAEETTEQHVREGLAIVEQAARELDLPINWVVVPEWLKPGNYGYPVFVLKRYTQYPWME